MAFVINPDGTIKLLEVKFDHSGNISPKRIIEGYGSSHSQQPLKKKKKNKATTTLSSVPEKTNEGVNSTVQSTKQVSSPKDMTPETKNSEGIITKKISPSYRYAPKTPEKKKIFQTKDAIDEYFLKRKELHQIVHQEIFEYAKKHLNSDMFAYFVKCFDNHNNYCRSQGWYKNEPEVRQRKTRKESAFSPIGNASTGKFVNSRHPVYGYARDRYGRVQERDSLNEDRKNEFRKSQVLQTRYDYSSYDSESDHDSYYDSNSYE